MSHVSLTNQPLFSKEQIERLTFAVGAIAVIAIVSMMEVMAGGTATTIFDTLNTNSQAAVFGPLGATIITVGAAAGGIFAIWKGAWLFAGMGIAVAALMVGAQFVATSSGFGALI